MRNSEYMAVLAKAVECVRVAMADRRLQDPTPEQIAWWLQSTTVADVTSVMKGSKTYSNLEVVWRRAA